MEDKRVIGLSLAILGVLLVIVMTFVKIGFDAQATYLCELVSEDPNQTMADCPAHQSNVPWLVFVGFGVSIAILAAGLYLYFLKASDQRASDQRPHKKPDVSKLDAEEKRIVELLDEQEGSMYQSDLIRETDHSKVKMTRLLDKLESKNVIERKRRGMTNIVVLR